MVSALIWRRNNLPVRNREAVESRRESIVVRKSEDDFPRITVQGKPFQVSYL